MTSRTISQSSSSHPSHIRQRRNHRIAGRLSLILHSLNVGFCLISLGIFTAIIPVWNANFFHSTGIVRGDWPDGLPVIPLFITLVASLHYLTKLCLARRASTKPGDYLKSRQSSHRPARPSKINLYVTLTTLILLLTFLILAAISGLYRFWRPAVITSSVQLSSGTASTSTTLSTLSLRNLARSISDSNPTSPSVTPPQSNPSAHNAKATFHSCTLANVFTRKCNPTLYLLGDLQITAISTGSLVWLLNFVLLILQIRDYQLQKRRHQRSLRAKAKAKFDIVEDEMSRAEKGVPPMKKKIHHDRKRGHSNSSSDSSLAKSEVSHMARPVRAYTVDSTGGLVDQITIRPKQHYYDPNITPSRSRSTRQPMCTSAINLTETAKIVQDVSHVSAKPHSGSPRLGQKQTAYSKAVDEARRKVKPAETMRDWLAGRY